MAYIKDRAIRLLRWSERYTGTDMVYLAQGGFWINMGSLTVTFFSLLLYIAFTRFLPKDVYGTYQYLLSIFVIVSTFTLTGMNTAVSRAVTRGYEGTYRDSIRLQFRWSIAPMIAALIGSLYYVWQENMLLAAGFALIGIATPFVTTFNTYSAFLTGKKDFRRVFLYNFALNVPYYGALILTAFYLKSALALLFVNLIVNALMLAILHARVLRTFKPNDATDTETLSYGKHLSAMSVFTALIGQIDNVLVFHYLGAVDLAIYSLATAVPDRAANFARFFSMTAMPKFAERTEEQIRDTIGRKLFILTLVAAVGAMIYMAAAPFLFSLFFPQYAASVPFSALYALTMLGTAGNVALSALSAKRRTKDLYMFNGVTPVLQLALQFGGVLFYGLWGLVIGKTLSALLASGIAVMLLLRNRGPKSASAHGQTAC